MSKPSSAEPSKNRDARWLLEEKYGGAKSPAYEADLARLKAGEPVAYVIGHQPFLGLEIYLDSHPLIPRPETEWWTERMLSAAGAVFSATSSSHGGDMSAREGFRSATAREEAIRQQVNTPPSSNGLSSQKQVSFLDLCAGSGAIGCAALKYRPGAQVYFGELDAAHEKTILKNVRENNLDGQRAHIRIGDLFEPFGDMQFDVIASNPPYIADDRELEPSVANYEPALALRSGTDGLDLIRRIATELPKHLAPGGEAWIECDSAHAAAACALFTAQGLTASIRTDQYDQPRLIVVSLS
ncbi:MAG: peptide chain release factor N(5)-glutamine methyltransferase [Candidatus Paceibacterota bacterium]